MAWNPFEDPRARPLAIGALLIVGFLIGEEFWRWRSGPKNVLARGTRVSTPAEALRRMRSGPAAVPEPSGEAEGPLDLADLTYEDLLDVLTAKKDAPSARAFARDFMAVPELRSAWEQVRRAPDADALHERVRRLRDSNAFAKLLAKYKDDIRFQALSHEVLRDPTVAALVRTEKGTGEDRLPFGAAATGPPAPAAPADGARPRGAGTQRFLARAEGGESEFGPPASGRPRAPQGSSSRRAATAPARAAPESGDGGAKANEPSGPQGEGGLGKSASEAGGAAGASSGGVDTGSDYPRVVYPCCQTQQSCDACTGAPCDTVFQKAKANSQADMDAASARSQQANQNRMGNFSQGRAAAKAAADKAYNDAVKVADAAYTAAAQSAQAQYNDRCQALPNYPAPTDEAKAKHDADCANAATTRGAELQAAERRKSQAYGSAQATKEAAYAAADNAYQQAANASQQQLADELAAARADYDQKVQAFQEADAECKKDCLSYEECRQCAPSPKAQAVLDQVRELRANNGQALRSLQGSAGKVRLGQKYRDLLGGAEDHLNTAEDIISNRTWACDRRVENYGNQAIAEYGKVTAILQGVAPEIAVAGSQEPKRTGASGRAGSKPGEPGQTPTTLAAIPDAEGIQFAVAKQGGQRAAAARTAAPALARVTEGRGETRPGSGHGAVASPGAAGWAGIPAATGSGGSARFAPPAFEHEGGAPITQRKPPAGAPGGKETQGARTPDGKGGEQPGSRGRARPAGEAKALIDKAWALITAGDFAGAEAAARRALELDPRNAAALEVLSLAEVRQGKLSEAVRTASEAIELDPSLADAYSVRSAARAMLGDLEGSLADREQAMSLDTGRISAERLLSVLEAGRRRASRARYRICALLLLLALGAVAAWRLRRKRPEPGPRDPRESPPPTGGGA